MLLRVQSRIQLSSWKRTPQGKSYHQREKKKVFMTCCETLLHKQQLQRGRGDLLGRTWQLSKDVTVALTSHCLCSPHWKQPKGGAASKRSFAWRSPPGLISELSRFPPYSFAPLSLGQEHKKVRST